MSDVLRPSRLRMQSAMNQALLNMLGRPVEDLGPVRAPAKAGGSKHQRVIIRLEFRGIEPKIWRRFSVPGDLQARDLVKVVRKVAGWPGAHMDAVHFPRPAPSVQRPLLVAERLQSGDGFRYTYDFGSPWTHDLVVESVEVVSSADHRVVLIAGERACPPDDCGGAAGYAELCQALAKKRPSRLVRWVKEVSPNFEPEAFDVGARNSRSLSHLSLRFGIPAKARRRKTGTV